MTGIQQRTTSGPIANTNLDRSHGPETADTLMKRYTLFILSAVFTSLYAIDDQSMDRSSYGTLTGTVIDSVNGEPLEYASISITRPRDKKIVDGGISRENGLFKIQHRLSGNYDITVEHIGYDKKRFLDIAFSDETGPVPVLLDTLLLSPRTILLDQVNADGQRPVYSIGVDKKTFQVSDIISLTAGTASDALRNIPAVDVDMDGVISLRGDKNVRLLINGSPTGIGQEDRRTRVDLLPNGLIERIEVITNPSPEHDPEGMAGIINIILKENLRTGLSSHLSLGNHGRSSASAGLDHSKGDLNLHLSASANSGYTRTLSHRNFVWDYSGFTLTSEQRKTHLSRPVAGVIRVGGSHRVLKDHELDLFSTVSIFDHGSNDTINHISPVEYDLATKDNRNGWTLDLSGKHAWYTRDRSRSLVTSLFFSRSGEHEKDVNDRNVSGTGPDDHSHIYKDDAFSTISVRSVYNHAIKKGMNLKTGVESVHRTTDQELEYLHFPFGFDHEERIQAVFFDSHFFGSKRLRMEGGLRLETVGSRGVVREIMLPDDHHHQDTTNTFTSLIDSSITNSPFSQTYSRLYPSLRVRIKPFETVSLDLNYGRRTNRPKRSSLNPFPVSMIDDYHTRVGNPGLRPEFIDILEIGAHYKQRGFWIYGNMFYKSIVDLIRWYDRDLVNIDDRIYEVITADNAGTATSFGTEFHLNYRPTETVSIDLGANNWNTNASSAGEPDLNGNSSGYLVRTHLSMLLPKDIHSELFANYRGKMRIPTGTVEPSYYMDIALSKRFRDRNLVLIVSVNDIFNGRTFNITTDQSIYNPTSGYNYTQHLDASRTQDGRFISISLKYHLGFKKWEDDALNQLEKAPRTEKDMDMDY